MKDLIKIIRSHGSTQQTFGSEEEEFKGANTVVDGSSSLFAFAFDVMDEGGEAEVVSVGAIDEFWLYSLPNSILEISPINSKEVKFSEGKSIWSKTTSRAELSSSWESVDKSIFTFGACWISIEGSSFNVFVLKYA